jgi:hypothetical protein
LTLNPMDVFSSYELPIGLPSTLNKSLCSHFKYVLYPKMMTLCGRFSMSPTSKLSPLDLALWTYNF